jgi:hypothetical protein
MAQAHEVWCGAHKDLLIILVVNVNTERNRPTLERGIDNGTMKVNVTMKVNGKLVLRTNVNVYNNECKWYYETRTTKWDYRKKMVLRDYMTRLVPLTGIFTLAGLVTLTG